MKKIKVELSTSSIDSAINELRAYRENLTTRISTFVDTLVQEGVKVAGIRVASTQGDSKLPDVTYEIDSSGEIVKAKIAIVGKDVLFVEFGAGIAYNTGKQNPYAEQFGYGIGTYPSKHPPNRAMNPGFWYYTSHDSVGDNVRTRSIGTEASMPLYGAAETIRNQAIVKAVETFIRG